MDDQSTKVGGSANSILDGTGTAGYSQVTELTVQLAALSLNPTFFDFMGLPPEIRLIIYSYICDCIFLRFDWASDDIKVVRRQYDTIYQYKLRPDENYPKQLLMINKATRLEAMPVIRDNIHLWINAGRERFDQPILREFLTGPRMLSEWSKRIRRVHFAEQSYLKLDLKGLPNLQFISCCAGYDCCEDFPGRHNLAHAGNHRTAAEVVMAMIRRHADLTEAGRAWYDIPGLNHRREIRIVMRANVHCQHPEVKHAWLVEIEVRKWRVLSVSDEKNQWMPGTNW